MSNEPHFPRDWLLDRHRSVEARLDAARVAALGLCAPAQSPATRSLLHELFFPQRVVWAALAFVWTLLLAIHVSTVRSARRETANSISPAAIAAWLAQNNTHDSLAHSDSLD